MSKLFIINDTGSLPHSNCLQEIQRLADESQAVVLVSEKKPNRSDRQNRTFHMWVRDIQMQSGEAAVEIGGRCKLQYFVPVLLASGTVKTRAFRELWEVIAANYSYEKQIEMLGRSAIASTSLLTTQEFAAALTDMQHGELQNYTLRDPELMGLEL